MKKTSLLTISVILISFSIFGCSSETSIEEGKIAALESQISRLQAENESLKANEKMSTEESFEKTNNTQESSQINDDDYLQLGNTIVVDNIMELTLVSCEWSQDILPSNTEGSYNYIEGTAGESFLILKGTVKNLASETFSIDNCIKTQFLVNNKYKLDGSLTCEESDGTGVGEEPKPLQTLNIMIYTALADELKEQFENGTITININSDTGRINKRFDSDEPHNVYIINITLDDFLTS